MKAASERIAAFAMSMSKTYQVYVLENLSGKRYIGLTEDVTRRLEEHNDGKSRWTARHRPWDLLWTSRPLSLTEARKLENKMKRQKGGDGLKVLMEEFNRSSGS